MTERRSNRARIGVAAFWIVAGALHFVIPRQYRSIVPPAIGDWKSELVVASGIAEIAGGLAVLSDRTKRGARWWLLATLVAVFPANIHMAVNAEDFKDIPEAALWARLPFQAVFAWMTWRGTE
ncbi:MAG: DoxX family protein [Thermoleophilaceae bacterium]